MVIKFGRFGEFLACSNYPECKTTKEIAKGDAAEAGDDTIMCEKCGKPMTLKRSRFGQFFACTGYPDCRNTKDPRLLKAGIPNEPQPPANSAGVLRAAATAHSGFPASPIAATSARSAAARASADADRVKCPQCGQVIAAPLAARHFSIRAIATRSANSEREAGAASVRSAARSICSRSRPNATATTRPATISAATRRRSR